MSIETAISLLIAIISVVFSIFGYRQSKNAFKQSEIAYKQSNTVANAGLEINVYNILHDARQSFYEVTKLAVDLSDSMDEKIQLIDFIKRSAIEEYLNAYEEACDKYLTKKIDQDQFKRRYRWEVINLVEDKGINSVMDFKEPEIQTDYKSIYQVYKDFKNN